MKVDKNWLDRMIKKYEFLIPGTDIVTETVDVTPEFAHDILLEYNTRNRPIRASNLKRITKAMRDGKWRLTSETISFANDGKLNDGQHRLMGVMNSGETVRMTFAFGEEPDVFHVLDSGAGRSGSDAISVSGKVSGKEFKNVRELASSIGLIMFADNNGSKAIDVSKELLTDFVHANPSLHEHVALAHGVSKSRLISRSVLAATTFLIERDSGASIREINEFRERFIDGACLQANDPLLVLRNGLMERKLYKHKLDSGSKNIMYVASLIKTWNNRIRGKNVARVTTLEWKSSEEFPKAV